ncbi:MAG: (2Fe-2S)-binding protein [Armatimonadota bacterium]
MTHDTIICRCEEVTVGDIEEAIAAGARTLRAVQLRTRLGMGLCQGRTCAHLAAGLLARRLDRPRGHFRPRRPRPPVRPIPLHDLAKRRD